jgi:16S rRNA (guanine966-N2)-methyltransferase
VGSNVLQALSRLALAGQRFAWVFVDPPYATDDAQRTLDALAGGAILTGGGIVVIEHDKRRVPPESAGDLHLVDRRIYGDTGVSFYRRNTSLA